MPPITVLAPATPFMYKNNFCSSSIAAKTSARFASNETSTSIRPPYLSTRSNKNGRCTLPTLNPCSVCTRHESPSAQAEPRPASIHISTSTGMPSTSGTETESEDRQILANTARTSSRGTPSITTSYASLIDKPLEPSVHIQSNTPSIRKLLLQEGDSILVGYRLELSWRPRHFTKMPHCLFVPRLHRTGYFPPYFRVSAGMLRQGMTNHSAALVCGGLP